MQLLFGQTTSLESLRSIYTCLQAYKGQLYHLGVKQNVDHTPFPRANENRDWRILLILEKYHIGLIRSLYANVSAPIVNINNEAFALGSQRFH